MNVNITVAIFKKTEMPFIKNESACIRYLMLCAQGPGYEQLWKKCWKEDYKNENWSKNDNRLDNSKFSQLSEVLSDNILLKTDYERRQALVEIDVLIAMELGLTLEQLISIYKLQFPVLQSNENDTWYDVNGRIVFTNSRGLTGVGFDRKDWESKIKDAPIGSKFYRTIIDDTVPNGPVERTIEYIAPFVKCNREKDYEVAWHYFENKEKTL